MFCLSSLQDEVKTDCPHMCAYKLVTVKFRWWGLQTKVESFIQKVLLNNLLSWSKMILFKILFYWTAFTPVSLDFSPLLFIARKAYFYKLPPPALLLD